MRIVAFGHRRFTGKDTCATYLKTEHVLHNKRAHVLKVGFGSLLKEMCHTLYGWAGLQGEDYYEQHPQEKETILPAIGKSVRDIWIEFGTTVCRSIYDNTWLDVIFRGLKCDLLLIKDLRFPNEAEAIRKHKGILIRVDRNEAPMCDDVADSALKDWTDWDYVISNNSDHKELYARVKEIYGKII